MVPQQWKLPKSWELTPEDIDVLEWEEYYETKCPKTTFVPLD